jgi:cytochrome P450 family 12
MLTKQVCSLTRRAYCTATNLASDIKNARPFSEIPTMSFFKVAKGNLPGGKYYKKSMREIQQLFYEEYGSIMKIPAMLGRPQFVITFNPDDFETVSIRISALDVE